MMVFLSDTEKSLQCQKTGIGFSLNTKDRINDCLNGLKKSLWRQTYNAITKKASTEAKMKQAEQKYLG